MFLTVQTKIYYQIYIFKHTLFKVILFIIILLIIVEDIRNEIQLIENAKEMKWNFIVFMLKIYNRSLIIIGEHNFRAYYWEFIKKKWKLIKFSKYQ